jgi:hypothetical protein
MYRGIFASIAFAIVLAIAGIDIHSDAAGFFHGRAGGSAGGGSGTVVFTKTFYNSSVSATPTGVDGTFPIHTAAWAAYGAVPSGQIMVPTVAGSPVRYQADRCARPWADGSMTGCQFTMFLPGLSAGATEQVTWKTQTGSYNNTSSCTISCVTANSNLNIELTGVNSAYASTAGLPVWEKVGFYISGGSISSGVIRAQPALGDTGTGTVVIEGCAVPGGATVTPPSTVTITTPGSGCAVQGSGAYTASANTALGNGAFNGSNHCGILRQNMQGPVADSWEVACQFTDNVGGAPWTFPGPIARFWVEDYKNADGSVYAVRAVGATSDGRYQAASNFTSYTYDMQWQNGATCIRCASAGYVPFTRIVQEVAGQAMTFGPAAQMDWIPVAGGVTSAALNAVIVTMTAGDKAYLKAAGVILPIDDNVNPGASHEVLTATGTQGLSSDIGSYNPFTLGDQDDVGEFGSGGNHAWFGPVPSNGMDHYWYTTIAADKGLSWLQNNRVAAASEFSCMAGVYEQATINAVDVVPTSAFPQPTGMTDPVRLTASILSPGFDMLNDGLPCNSFNNGNIGGNPFDFTHYPNHGRYIYLMEGEEWQLRAMDAFVSNLMVATPSYNENPIIFGGVTYRGLVTETYIHRQAAWSMNVLGSAVKFLPPSDINAQYYTFLLFQNYDVDYAWSGYTGTCTIPLGSSTKPYSLNASGFPASPDEVCLNVEGGTGITTPPYALISSQFMDWYRTLILLDHLMLFKNENSSLTSFATNNVQNYSVAASANPCLYNSVNYVTITSDSAGNPLPGWSADFSNPQRPNAYERYNQTFMTFAGQSRVEAAPLVADYIPINAYYSTTATATVAAGLTTLSVSDLSQFAVGSIIFDVGQSSTLVATGGVVPAGTGAIPSYTKVITTSGSSGAGTITIDHALVSPGVVSGDVLAFSNRMDYPDASLAGTVPTAVGTPMPSGSLVRPINGAFAGNGGEYSPSANYFGTFPPPSTPQVSDLIGSGGSTNYVWCPDDSYGTTGYINEPGTACSTTADRIVFNANTAQTWGWWANAACPTSPAGTSWNVPAGDVNADSRMNQQYGIAKLSQALLGTTTNATTAITNLSAILPDSIYNNDPGDTYWAFSKTTAPGS